MVADVDAHLDTGSIVVHPPMAIQLAAMPSALASNRQRQRVAIAHLVKEGGRANREAEALQRTVQVLDRDALLEDAAGLNLDAGAFVAVQVASH